MGHDRGFFGTLFLTIIGSLLMIVSGTALAVAAVLIIGGYTGILVEGRVNLVFVMSSIAALYVIVSAIVGLSWGFSNRAANNRARMVEQDNIRFLDENGFSDVGLGEDVIEDGEGNRLKLKAEEIGKLVFTVVGRRNIRAAIELDDEGRMIAYTGAVRL